MGTTAGTDDAVDDTPLMERSTMGILRWIGANVLNARHFRRRSTPQSILDAHPAIPGERKRHERPSSGVRHAMIVIAAVAATYATIALMLGLIALL
jgi:hypothetical protein